MRKICYILLVSTCIACSGNKDKIAKVETLDELLNSTEEIFDQVEFSAVSKVDTVMMNQLLFVQENQVDTMVKEDALILGSYYTLKKAIHHFVEKEPEMRKELEYCRGQVANMITDLESGNMNMDSFNGYYNMEMDAILDLNKRVSDATNNVVKSLPKYDAEHPEIERIVNQLKASLDTTES